MSKTPAEPSKIQKEYPSWALSVDEKPRLWSWGCRTFFLSWISNNAANRQTEVSTKKTEKRKCCLVRHDTTRCQDNIFWLKILEVVWSEVDIFLKKSIFIPSVSSLQITGSPHVPWLIDALAVMSVGLCSTSNIKHNLHQLFTLNLLQFLCLLCFVSSSWKLPLASCTYVQDWMQVLFN